MYGVPWPISVVQLAVGDSVDGWSKDAFSIVVHHNSKRAPIWVDSTETNEFKKLVYTPLRYLEVAMIIDKWTMSSEVYLKYA